jgi:hypothetical protein|tara:strand:+ start:142 stop:1149 length:1008 start_codon:yes stop_codon:yes gene_type:complete
MLWSKNKKYYLEPFEQEKHLEESIIEVQTELFGKDRIYLDTKRMIGKKGGVKNVPDGYLIDLSSKHNPKLYVVENELARHHPIKHIAVQILEFSLSFETSNQTVKKVVKEALLKDKKATIQCELYAKKNNFENIDFLLESMIFKENSFNALVIIDEFVDELEKVLIKKFNFPVELIVLKRFKSLKGDILYNFQPFLSDVLLPEGETPKKKSAWKPSFDVSEIDTIICPALDEGFENVFIGEKRWYEVSIQSSIISQLKYIGAYRVAPISAITHIAQIESIKQWKDTNKYIIYFTKPAKKIKPIKLVPKSVIKAPQRSRYTTRKLLDNAKNLDEAF